ncbi:MAG: cobalt ECF transporter T component CbiQ [Chloroflexota bacterium]|nr:cobalt ECF transporter T component CbiQ [Chloroflexota bacterium]
MHIHILDQHIETNSIVHRLDPRVKLVSALVFILACALTPDGAWLAFAALGVLLLVLIIISDLSIMTLMKRSIVALPFALAAVTVMFTIPGETLATIPLPFSAGKYQLSISDAGLVRFVTIMLKSWLSVLMALLLSATTTFPDILRAMRGIGVPRVLVSVIAFMYRYIFVLGDEALRLMRAREARTATGSDGRRSGGNIIWRAKVVGGMAGSLFVRSLSRSERVYQAMVSRGYTGEMLWLEKPRLQGWHLAVGGLFIAILAAIEALAWLS